MGDSGKALLEAKNELKTLTSELADAKLKLRQAERVLNEKIDALTAEKQKLLTDL